MRKTRCPGSKASSPENTVLGQKLVYVSWNRPSLTSFSTRKRARKESKPVPLGVLLVPLSINFQRIRGAGAGKPDTRRQVTSSQGVRKAAWRYLRLQVWNSLGVTRHILRKRCGATRASRDWCQARLST